MGWDFDYTVRTDSGAHQNLVDLGYATTVRIPSVIANAHGERLESRTFFGSYDFVLQVDLSYGPVTPTHTDGSPGHVYENRSEVNALLLGHTERVWIGREAPHQGLVEIPVIVQRVARTGSPRHRLVFTCHALDPFWRDQAVTFNAVNPVSGVTIGGDAPVGDGSFSFSGTNGVQRVTQSATGDFIELDADTTSTAIVVDCGTGAVTQGGTPVAGMTGKKPWLIELFPGLNNFGLTGGGSVTFTGRDKWL